MDAAEAGDCSPCGPDLCPGKRMWPELVGAKGSEAKEIIERENPNVKVVFIWCHWKRIMDCCCNRVWLFVEGEDGWESGDYGEAKVCYIPRVG
ncbi:uncharacterized protein A4U43_C05F4740 [Asparagus officinalis]|uniref:Uncharacterized protein n=1 Tax=Asparagus officinalis TaxID=4686 RepID=A0A5P1EPE7_ASPOF|nr:inhibitor of trypsin and hageman factor-like isoform X2 [Asparagus officinalis]ONK67878.1 uncharacterized protein A4U43_C05F4740 [Asparagus officinalis]